MHSSPQKNTLNSTDLMYCNIIKTHCKRFSPYVIVKWNSCVCLCKGTTITIHSINNSEPDIVIINILYNYHGNQSTFRRVRERTGGVTHDKRPEVIKTFKIC